MKSAVPTIRSLDPSRPRAWSPACPLRWSSASKSNLDQERRQRFDDQIAGLRWHADRAFAIEDEPALDALPRLDAGQRVWAVAYSFYRFEGRQHEFIGIAVGNDEPEQLRFYLPTETGGILLADKPVEYELLNRIEKALVVTPTNINKVKPFRSEVVQWPEFTATPYMDALGKRALAEQIVDFIDAGFPQAAFKGDLLKYLSQMYDLQNGHYTLAGFYLSNFSTLDGKADFVESVIVGGADEGLAMSGIR